jgi:SAM-dependent methyltransferase
MTFRKYMGRFAGVRVAAAVGRTLRDQFGLNFRWIVGLWSFVVFFREYRLLKRLNAGTAYVMTCRDIFPALTDRTSSTPIEPIYFHQDAWFAGRIARHVPSRHVDIGSSIKSMSMLAQFFPITFVDIRTIDVEVANLETVVGSVLDLPFENASIESLSSLCVIEHIGLGRYGDHIDGHGSEKAAAELMRVLRHGGNLYFSVPIDDRCRIYFNAHRSFTREHVLSLFPSLQLIDERYIYGLKLVSEYRPDLGFGTGLYHFRRTHHDSVR